MAGLRYCRIEKKQEDPLPFNILRLAAAVVLSLAALAATAEAAAMRIECPYSQVESGVITQLPAPWYSTPVRGPLVDTRITTQANGERLLNCSYQSYRGNLDVSQAAPQGMDCTADGSGFTCTSGGGVVGQPVPGPANGVVRVTGTQDLPPSYTADLDSGMTGTGGDDLWFHAEGGGGTDTLAPTNGAALIVVDFASGNYQGCSAASGYVSQGVAVSLLSAGSTLCVRTSEGRLAVVQITAPPQFNNGRLAFGFTTWEF